MCEEKEVPVERSLKNEFNDRAYCCSEIIQSMIGEHPYLEEDAKASKKVAEVCELLSNLYHETV